MFLIYNIFQKCLNYLIQLQITSNTAPNPNVSLKTWQLQASRGAFLLQVSFCSFILLIVSWCLSPPLPLAAAATNCSFLEAAAAELFAHLARGREAGVRDFCVQLR